MTRQRFDDMPPAQQAGIICNDAQFQTFAAAQCGFPGGQFSENAAAEYLRSVCDIPSRSDLNHNAQANAKFQELRTEFDAARGKIASPQ